MPVPTLKSKTLTKLKAALPNLSPRLQIVAKYIVDHPSDFGLDPIRETARKAGVSTYTLVRMAEKLGFEGYDGLRDPFRQALVSNQPELGQPNWLGKLREGGEMGQVQAEAAINSMAIMQRSFEQQNSEQMQRVVRHLLEADRVYLTAVRASHALAYYLHYVARMALPNLQLVSHTMNSTLDELNFATKDDVMIAITFTPYSRETIEACKIARARGVKLIILSDSDVISTEFQADETLVVATSTTHHFACFSGAMAVIESLMALLEKQAGPPGQARIKSFETLRNDNNAYWTKQKKH